jgi:hypothetical protein
MGYYDEADSSSSSSDSESSASPNAFGENGFLPNGKTKAQVGSEDRAGVHMDESDKDGERREDMSPLTDLECVIASPRVKGFDLSAKEWCTLKNTTTCPGPPPLSSCHS